jgi:hypothetical protein
MQSPEDKSERPNISRWAIIVALLALLCLPFALIGLSILERSIFNTAYLSNAYRTVGIHESLQSLYDPIAPWLKK